MFCFALLVFLKLLPQGPWLLRILESITEWWVFPVWELLGDGVYMSTLFFFMVGGVTTPVWVILCGFGCPFVICFVGWSWSE